MTRTKKKTKADMMVVLIRGEKEENTKG